MINLLSFSKLLLNFSLNGVEERNMASTAKVVVLGVVLGLAAIASEVAAAPVNPGFETGDTTGWSETGDVSVSPCAFTFIGCAPSGEIYFVGLNDFTFGVGNASLTQDLGLFNPGMYEFGAYVTFGTNNAAANFAQGQISLTSQGTGQSETLRQDPNGLNGQFNTEGNDGIFFTNWFLLKGIFNYTGNSAAPFLLNINVQDGTAENALVLTADNVFVKPVPIPAALPLFATGVAAVGYAGRRKRKAAQAAA
jgi:hypothetical protein